VYCVFNAAPVIAENASRRRPPRVKLRHLVTIRLAESPAAASGTSSTAPATR
jgi:hypothetical protein